VTGKGESKRAVAGGKKNKGWIVSQEGPQLKDQAPHSCETSPHSKRGKKYQADAILRKQRDAE